MQERDEFELYDKVSSDLLLSVHRPHRLEQTHCIRAAFIKELENKFGDYGLTFSIGGKSLSISSRMAGTRPMLSDMWRVKDSKRFTSSGQDIQGTVCYLVSAGRL